MNGKFESKITDYLHRNISIVVSECKLLYNRKFDTWVVLNDLLKMGYFPHQAGECFKWRTEFDINQKVYFSPYAWKAETSLMNKSINDLQHLLKSNKLKKVRIEDKKMLVSLRRVCGILKTVFMLKNIHEKRKGKANKYMYKLLTCRCFFINWFPYIGLNCTQGLIEFLGRIMSEIDSREHQNFKRICKILFLWMRPERELNLLKQALN